MFAFHLLQQVSCVISEIERLSVCLNARPFLTALILAFTGRVFDHESQTPVDSISHGSCYFTESFPFSLQYLSSDRS